MKWTGVEDKLLNVFGTQGFETYVIDQNTIGVRPKWISVKDKLPATIGQTHGGELNVSESVLVYDEREGIVIAYLEEDEETTGWVTFLVDSSLLLLNVTHWMPLPEGPPGEEKTYG